MSETGPLPGRIECPGCAKSVTSARSHCPNCGKRLPRPSSPHAEPPPPAQADDPQKPPTILMADEDDPFAAMELVLGPPDILAAPTTSQAPTRTRSVSFHGTEHTTPQALASAFAADFERAGKALFAEFGPVRQETETLLRAHRLDEALHIITSDTTRAWEPTLLRLLAEMDPQLTPRINNTDVTPAGIATLATTILNADTTPTATQNLITTLILDHQLWRSWRHLPGMHDAPTAADHLIPASQWTAALSQCGFAWNHEGGIRRPSDSRSARFSHAACLVLDEAGQVRWVPPAKTTSSQPILLSEATVHAHWRSEGHRLDAWNLLQALDKTGTGRELDRLLKELRKQAGEATWWTFLANAESLAFRIVAVTTAGLANTAVTAQQTALNHRATAERRWARDRAVEAAIAPLQGRLDELRREREVAAQGGGIGCGAIAFLAFCGYLIVAWLIQSRIEAAAERGQDGLTPDQWMPLAIGGITGVFSVVVAVGWWVGPTRKTKRIDSECLRLEKEIAAQESRSTIPPGD